jgi:hypothetical protein
MRREVQRWRECREHLARFEINWTRGTVRSASHPMQQQSNALVQRRIAPMETVSLRAKLSWVAAGYAAVVAASTFLVAWRYMQYRWHPADANQYGGMWAGGDMVLGVFIFCLFMVPTFFLVLVARKSEPLYVAYAKVLFFISLTAPASIGLMAIPMMRESDSLLGWFCMWRLLGSPFLLAGMAGSRLLATFPRAKSWSLYAVLIEAATLGAMIVLFGVASRRH